METPPSPCQGGGHPRPPPAPHTLRSPRSSGAGGCAALQRERTIRKWFPCVWGEWGHWEGGVLGTWHWEWGLGILGMENGSTRNGNWEGWGRELEILGMDNGRIQNGDWEHWEWGALGALGMGTGGTGNEQHSKCSTGGAGNALPRPQAPQPGVPNPSTPVFPLSLSLHHPQLSVPSGTVSPPTHSGHWDWDHGP